MSAPPKYTDEPAPSQGAKYGSTYSDEPTKPLLNPDARPPSPSAGPSGMGRNAWTDQPSTDDLPDDFKVGVCVYDCDTSIRLAFIRKVYTILFLQILSTAVVAACMSIPSVVGFTHENSWVIWIPMVGSFITLLGVYLKRHDHPANLIMLSLFTLCEAVMVGTLTSYFESRIVLQALFITLGVFTGLTLFTFQTKFDFSSFAPFLFAGIWGLLAATMVSYFLPFSANTDLAVAGFSCVLFSGFILYDTQSIMKRLSVDEHILGSLSLYLDALNLFLSILRILNNQNNR